MSSGRHLKLMILTAAALLLAATCSDQATDDAEAEIASEPTPTSAFEASPTLGAPVDDEAASLPEIGEAPCEVRELEPRPDDAPETEMERIQDWLETTRTFNDVVIGPDGDVYIGSYRHAAVLIPGDDGTLTDVWWDGVRNTNQVAIHPDERVVLLQDNGIHFYDTGGEHQHYLSMFDADAGWFPDYVGIGIDSQGHVYVGVGPSSRSSSWMKTAPCSVNGRRWTSSAVEPRRGSPLMVTIWSTRCCLFRTQSTSAFGIKRAP